jgi:Uncharacterized phage-associated protein
MDMLDLARHIVAVANDNNVPITNVKLQGVLYFSLKDALLSGTLNEPQFEQIYDMPFEVWQYGAVVRPVFEHYSRNGATPIIKNYVRNPTYQNLDKFIVKYLSVDSFALVHRARAEKFWLDNKQYIAGWRSLVPYTMSDIISD